VENQLDGISYRDADGLRYLQNELDVTVTGKLLTGLRLSVKNNLRLRAYHTESEFYPGYFQYKGQTYLNYITASLSRIGVQYTYYLRSHPNYADRNYREHRWYGYAHFPAGRVFSILGDYTYRDRTYSVVNDSSFINSFQEHFTTVDVRTKIFSWLTPRLEADALLRLYANDFELTPDYFDLEVRPALIFELGSGWSVTMGYLYHSRDYNHLIPAAGAGLEEDYYANGAIFGLDLFAGQGIMFSLLDTFQMRRYPKSSVTAVSQYNLYTDRNINNILLFASWKLSSNWIFNAFFNLDDDRQDRRENNDSRNTLFSVELNYNFR
jgi:hypothetical protein